MGDLIPSRRSRQRFAGHMGALATPALFAAALARRVPSGSARTVRERPERKGRREERMSIRLRVRRGWGL